MSNVLSSSHVQPVNVILNSGNRISLNRLTSKSIGIVDLINNSELTGYYFGKLTAIQMQAMRKRYIEFEDKGGLSQGIYNYGTLIGFVVGEVVDEGQSLSLNFGIKTSSRGVGIMGDVLRLVKTCTRHDFKFIKSTITIDNYAAMKVLLSMGFRKDHVNEDGEAVYVMDIGRGMRH